MIAVAAVDQVLVELDHVADEAEQLGDAARSAHLPARRRRHRARPAQLPLLVRHDAHQVDPCSACAAPERRPRQDWMKHRGSACKGPVRPRQILGLTARTRDRVIASATFPSIASRRPPPELPRAVPVGVREQHRRRCARSPDAAARGRARRPCCLHLRSRPSLRGLYRSPGVQTEVPQRGGELFARGGAVSTSPSPRPGMKKPDPP